MKKWIVAAVTAAAFLAGCKESLYSVDSQGAPYEIIVVADHKIWDGPAGDTLRSIFYEQFPMVSRQETTFDVLRVLPGGFKKLVTRHRNIMITDIGAQFSEPSLTFAENVYASPQIVLTATAPDNASLAAFLDEQREDLLMLLEHAEQRRDVAAAETHTPPAIKELIKSKFGFDMSMGPGYTVRDEKEDFLWLSYEMPVSSQGIIIYTYPFSGVADFERDNLLKRRNEFAAKIPGQNKGSYMTSNPDYTELVFRTIDGRQWSELHGFWDVEGDFMGGPFTNYATLDAARQRVVAIDFYVYSPDPQLSQRNYIKQLEHFLYTVALPR
jgi:hypothetical protein